MSAEREVRDVGRVSIYEPTKSGANGHLWRLTWYVDGARRHSTAITDAKALDKADEINKRLEAGTTAKSEKFAAEMIAYFLDPGRPKPKPKKGPGTGRWSTTHAKKQAEYADRYFIPILGKKRCSELRVADFQKVVDATNTDSQGEKLRTACGTLIRAGRQGGFILASQHFDLKDVHRHGTSTAATSTQGELEGYVPRDERPTHSQVRALAEAAAGLSTSRTEPVWWRGLMVYLSAYSGVRIGELMALTFGDVQGRVINVNWQVDDISKTLTRPKMAKVRQTLFKAEPVAGVDLLGMMERRCEEARAEREAGTNPKGLLFPNTSGGWLHQSNFKRDVVDPAMTKAGWPVRPDWKPGREGSARKWMMPWHSLRHTFCTTALDEWGFSLLDVSLIAGHESVQTTARIYIGAMSGAIERMVAATE